MIRVLGAFKLSAMRMTTGRVLPASPKSANQISPWRGLVAINYVHYLLNNFATWEYVRPFFFLPPPFKKLQVMP